jgi:hypothetical protein
MSNDSERKDVHTPVTERIISDLEQGIRTLMNPWSVEHTTGRITKPLRYLGCNAAQCEDWRSRLSSVPAILPSFLVCATGQHKPNGAAHRLKG